MQIWVSGDLHGMFDPLTEATNWQLAIVNFMQRQLHCLHVDCTTKCHKYKSTYVLPSCRVASAVYYKVVFRVVIRER